MKKEMHNRWWADLTATEKLDRVLSGLDGEERNGVSVNKKLFVRATGKGAFYFAGVKGKRATLARRGERYMWLGKHFFSSDMLQLLVAEKEAEWILRYGRFEKDAGEAYCSSFVVVPKIWRRLKTESEKIELKNKEEAAFSVRPYCGEDFTICGICRTKLFGDKEGGIDYYVFVSPGEQVFVTCSPSLVLEAELVRKFICENNSYVEARLVQEHGRYHLSINAALSRKSKNE